MKQINQTTENLMKQPEYVIVIARDRVQYEIYFPGYDIFVSLFSEPSVRWPTMVTSLLGIFTSLPEIFTSLLVYSFSAKMFLVLF